MKINSFEKAHFLAFTLLIGSLNLPFYAESITANAEYLAANDNAESTTVKKVATVMVGLSAEQKKAITFVKNFFAEDKRKTDYMKVSDFLAHLSALNNNFPDITNKKSAQEIWDAIQANINGFPEEIQKFFNELDPHYAVMIISEKQGLDFFMELLCKDSKKAPKWSAFVDSITPFFKNNALYKKLHDALLSVREPKGWLRSKKIADALKPHISAENFPKALVQKAESLGILGMRARLKF